MLVGWLRYVRDGKLDRETTVAGAIVTPMQSCRIRAGRRRSAVEDLELSQHIERAIEVAFRRLVELWLGLVEAQVQIPPAPAKLVQQAIDNLHRHLHPSSSIGLAKMVEYYTILGRKVGSHIVSISSPPGATLHCRRIAIQRIQASLSNVCTSQLAMATLGTAFVGGYFGLSGGKKPQDKAKGPPINAGSKDEEKFIKYV